MLFDLMKERLEMLKGIPQGSIGYRHLRNPSAPYLTWYISDETITPDDSGRVYTRSSDGVIELLTAEKSPVLEAEIEALFPEYEIHKHEEYDYAEDVFEITFTFTAIEKGKIKHGNIG